MTDGTQLSGSSGMPGDRRGSILPGQKQDGLHAELPQLAALFVVKFDAKKG